MKIVFTKYEFKLKIIYTRHFFKKKKKIILY